MDRASAETWSKRVERWKESGLTAQEFATEVGISAGSLKWWKWRLGSGRKPRTAKARTERAKSSAVAQTPALTFIEMPALAAPTAEPLEIVLPTTVRIHVRTGFDESTLRRVLDVLEQRR